MKLRYLTDIGNTVFDYFIITLLLNFASILVIPFYPIVVGTVEYFITEKEERSLKIIFISIKDNIKMISKITFFLVVVMTFGVVNILYLNTEYIVFDSVIKGFSYVLLGIGVLTLIHSPIIVLKMNISMKELFVNMIGLIFGNVLNFILELIVLIGFLFIVSNYYVVYFIGIYFVVYTIARLSYINLLNLKEKRI